MQKKLFNTIFKFSLISLLPLVLPVLIIEKYQLYFIILSENSILYIYSTIAQVLAGLMALTLVAVPYLYTLLEKNVQEDESWETAVSIAKENVFEYFLMIFIIGIVSILFCLFTMGAFNYVKYQDYSLTIATCSFLYFISILLYLIFYSFDPTRLSKISNEYVKKYLEKKSLKSNHSTQVISLDGIESEITSKDLEFKEEDNLHSSIGCFFIEYSKFEGNINTYYKNVVNSPKSPPFMLKINELKHFNLLPDDLYDEINNIRIFRNALAHTSHQMDLNKSLIDTLTLRIKNLNKIIEEKLIKLNDQYEII